MTYRMENILIWTAIIVGVPVILFFCIFISGWGALTLLKYAHIYNTINFKNIMICGLAVCALVLPRVKIHTKGNRHE